MPVRTIVVVTLIAGVGVGFVLSRLLPRQQAERPRITLTDGSRHRVARVIDGDTIVLENGLKVRYMAVDTPEMGAYVEKAQPGAVEATEANRRLVQGRTVTLRIGPRAMDQYGRVLARIIVEHEGREVDVGMKLLRDGMGRAVSRDLNEVNWGEARRAEAEARVRKRGIWGKAGGKID